MPVERIKFSVPKLGLHLVGPKESVPETALRRAKGWAGRRERTLKSRPGSSLIAAEDAHSLVYWNGVWYGGVGSNFRKLTGGASTIKSSLNGERLTFSPMPPTVGKQDYLFVAGGGGSGLFKVDSAGAVTNWGIAPPGTQVVVAGSVALSQAVTSGSLTSNVLTLNFASHPFVVGMYVVLSGFAGAGVDLNAQTVLVTAITATSITAAFTHANIAATGTGTAAVSASGPLTGTYQYWVTFYNTITGTESNPFTPETSVSLSGKQVHLSSIPISSDAQVNARRIYRTVGNGAVGFLVTTIENNTQTTYTDILIDLDLEETELLFSNLNPRDSAFDFRECVGPHVGRMWWTRDAITGHGGRIYYSPAGRPEAVEGFVEVTSNDNAIQRIVYWNGSIWGISKSLIYEVVGFSEPFSFRDVQGSIGTDKPWTVQVTDYGIAYKSRDGELRIFNGSASLPLAAGQIGDLFRGGTYENLSGMENAAYSAYGRSEYLIGDGSSTTLALYLDQRKEAVVIRELGGIGVRASAISSAGELALSTGGKVLKFETVGQLSDDGTGIPIEWEIPSGLTDAVGSGFIQRVYLDAHTGGSSISVTLILESGTVALGTFSSASRTVTELPVGQAGRIIGVRLSHAGISAALEVFGVEVDVWLSKELYPTKPQSE